MFEELEQFMDEMEMRAGRSVAAAAGPSPKLTEEAAEAEEISDWSLTQRTNSI